MQETSLLNQQLDALLYNEPNSTANLANASALLMQTVADLNWAGFYLYQPADDELTLGPFQGKVACMHIKNGQGVCGTALSTKQVLRVDNVHDFPGHIACDSDSNAELVVPIYKNDGTPYGVLDIDSPVLSRFTEADESEFSLFADILKEHIDLG